MKTNQYKTTNLFSMMISKRYFLVLALALAGMTAKAQAIQYSFYYTEGNTFYFLARNGTNGFSRINTFDASTSIWTASAALPTATWVNQDNINPQATNFVTLTQNVNGTNYYMVGGSDNVALTLSNNAQANSRFFGLVSRNGVYRLNSRYAANSGAARVIYWNGNNWINQAKAQEGNPNGSLTATLISGPTSVAWVTSSLTISSTNGNSFDAPGNTTLSTSATYSPAYYTLAPTAGSTTTYYAVNGQTPTGTTPSSSATITWSPNNTTGWTLTSGIYDDGHVRINSSTGYVEYYNEYDDDTDLVVKATASATGLTDLTGTYTISIEATKEDPTAIHAATTVTIYMGTTGTLTYTLEPVGAYDNVTGVSSNTGIFTVGTISHGTATINPVAVGSATLTLTAHKNNGDPITPSATVTVNVRNKVATPEITFTANREGTASTTITCATAGATIYYKVNDAASYTTYSAPFDVNEYDYVHAYASMVGNPLWDDSDIETKQYVPCTTAEPVITYTTANQQATVTITAETGASIYYTYGDTPADPTPTSYNGTGTTSVTFSGPTNGQVVKAIAKNGTCSASGVVSKTIYVSGVSGGVVTLNDLEDHSWSYYSDGNQPIHSLNPADVKITYFGNGTGTVTNASENGVTPASFSLDATTVAVSGYEPANQFVYYKTLENDNAEGNGSNYSYTLIPNPFSKRPTVGTISTAAGATCWRGFYGWRVKSLSSGLSIQVGTTTYTSQNINAASIIPAEREIAFVTTNEYGNEVQFEAMWAQAWFATAVNNTNNLNANVTYERNFIRVAGTINTTNSRPATIMELYPNGTTDGTTAATAAPNTARNLTGYALSADTKFEFIALSGTNVTMTANNHYLCFGRGISTANTATGRVQGITDPTNGQQINTPFDYTIRMESGRYSQLAFVHCVGILNNNGTWTDTWNTVTFTSTLHVNAIMGSDYDRALNDDDKLDVSAGRPLFFSQNVELNQVNRGHRVFDLVVKSGNYQRNYQNATIVGDHLQSFYCGPNNGSSTTSGSRYVTVEGGKFGSINGGTGGDDTDYDRIVFTLRMKGGSVEKSLYGAGANSENFASRKIIVTGGTVRGWIAGGANGTNTTWGASVGTGNSHIYVGGNAIVGGSNPSVLNGTDGGNIFGAGRGNANQAASMLNSEVVVADNADILRNVYGGGNYGYIPGESNVYVLGGTVHEKVFGGAYGNVSGNGYNYDIPVSNVYVRGGVVTEGVYGGSNWSGNVGNVTMHIDGGTVGSGEHGHGVFGGGLGQPTRVTGNVEVELGDGCDATEGATIYGDVYGGSALGTVNTNASNHTYVTLYKGVINGSLYGGGLGNDSYAANVYGPVAVKVFGGSVNTTSASGSGAVYGCNNLNGAPQNTVTVDIYGTDPAPSEDTYALDAVYGGGNQADYGYGTPTVTVHNCNNSIGYVYGGGNAAHITNATNGNTNVTIYGGNKIGDVFGGGNGTVVAANVAGNTSVKIYGGTILRVFGGSNSQGNIGGTISVNAESNPETGSDPCGNAYERCPIQVDTLFSGGNRASSNAGLITIGCMEEDDMLYNVFGGANQANIGTAAANSDITLNITGGRVGNLFGGNNRSGTVNGSITINVDWNDNCSDNYLGNVFGGGNKAAYGRVPDVNIKKGTVSGNVYGGGNEAGVAGGDVVMTGGTVLGGLYGGCNTSGVVSGDIVVSIEGGTVGAADSLDVHVTANVFGGGYGSETSTTGNVLVEIKQGTGVDTPPSIYGDVYGGSALGNVNTDDSNTTTVNILDGTLHSVIDNSSEFPVYIGGNVYGGGLGDATHEAAVNGNVTVNIGAGTPNTENPFGVLPTGVTGNATIGGNVYGCNNTKGSPQHDVTVNVYQTAHTADNGVDGTEFAIANVFGGGNQANYNANGTMKVNVYTCDNTIGRVFGGGDAAATKGVETNIQGGRFFQVFGGGNGETGAPGANVNGDVDLTILGGTVGEFYGGSNRFGTISGAINIVAGGNGPCGGLTVTDFFCGGNFVNITSDLKTTINCSPSDITITNLYGGCNQANIGSEATPANVVLNIYGGIYTNVFCGSRGTATNAANIYGNDTLNLYGGTIENVFGGSNVRGNISGSITVNVLDVEGDCPLYITNIYGGSNLASYEPGNADGISPVVNVAHAKYGIRGNVYGGGKGLPETDADVKSNPRVNIGYDPDMDSYIPQSYKTNYMNYLDPNNEDPKRPSAIVAGSVFGGGDAAKVIGSTIIYLRNRAKVFGNVYGGGNMGEVTGDTKVIVNGANQ